MLSALTFSIQHFYYKLSHKQGRVFISFFCQSNTHGLIFLLVRRKIGPQAVNISIVHAKCRCNENGVMDIFIRSTPVFGPGDILFRNFPAALLHLGSDREQCLYFIGYRGGCRIGNHTFNRVPIVVKMNICGSAVRFMAKFTIIELGNIGSNEFSLPRA